MIPLAKEEIGTKIRRMVWKFRISTSYRRYGEMLSASYSVSSSFSV
jgi:hypothetical protein